MIRIPDLVFSRWILEIDCVVALPGNEKLLAILDEMRKYSWLEQEAIQNRRKKNDRNN